MRPGSTLTNNSRIVASQEQVSCDLAGEAAILNLKSGVYYGLDPVGSSVWNLVQEPRTFESLQQALLDEYDAQPAELEQDVRELLTALAEQGLIEIAP